MKSKNAIEKISSLSPMQESVLFHSMMEGALGFYFEHITFELKGRCDIDILEQSFNELLKRFENYRSIYLSEGMEKPRKIVLRERKLKVELEDICSFPEKEQMSMIKNYMDEDRKRGFELSKDLLIRVRVFKLGEDSYKIVWSDHLINRDGWSFGIIVKDFFDIYNRILNHIPLSGMEKVVPFSNYISWLERQNHDEAIAYWKNYLADYTSVSCIPTRKHAEGQDYAYTEVKFSIDAEETNRLKNMAKKYAVTLNVLFQSIWGVLLQRYNNTDDVVFGNVVSGRPPVIPNIENMVGLFINTVPVRMTADGDVSFTSFMKKNSHSSFESTQYQYVNLAEIQNVSEIKKGLFDHIIIFENYPVPDVIRDLTKVQKLGFVVDNAKVIEKTSVPLNIEVMIGETLNIKIYFDGNQYEEAFIKSIEKNLRKIISQVLANNEILIKDIEIIADEQKEQILNTFNKKSVFAPAPALYDIFEQKVKKDLDKTAIIFYDKAMTYEEVERAACQCAYQLSQNGVGAGSTVALLCERSFEMVCGILGILKLGAAYIPIDIDWPKERISSVLDDSKCSNILITSYVAKERKQLFSIDKVKIIDMTELMSMTELSQDEIPKTKKGEIAYIIYTSGSTGKAKGVMVRNDSVVNILSCLEKQYPMKDGDAFLLKTAYNFDVSVTEILGFFFGEGHLVILPQSVQRDPACILEHITKYQVTHINFIPSMLDTILDMLDEKDYESFASLKYVFVAGEAILPSTVNKFYQQISGVELVNLYGPTEATIYATGCLLESPIQTVNTPIGYPLENMNAYILDQYNHLQPVGVPGELMLGGAGLAEGYVNLPDLTEEKFQSIEGILPEPIRLYCSGDLAKWLPNGMIEYMGRMDFQVKIRGFRIEIGEIENLLTKYSPIGSNVVVAKEDSLGNKYLCAYVVLKESGSIEKQDILNYLRTYVPDYMVPEKVIFIDEMPLNASGKVDRKKLPDDGGKQLEVMEDNEPKSELERILLEQWKKELLFDRLGVKHNFFDVGGHSLKALQLASKLKKCSINVSVNDIFAYPTVRLLAEHIEGSKERKKDEQITLASNLVEAVRKQFGIEISYEEIQKGRKTLSVMKVPENADIAEVKQYIQRIADKKLLPHYFCNEQSEITFHEIGECPEKINQFLSQIEQQMDGLTRQITSQNVVGLHDVSSVQKYHLEKHEFEMVGTIILLDGYIDREKFNQAFQKLLESEELLRCTLHCHDEKGYQWTEYRVPDRVTVPFLDLSEYSDESVNKIMKAIMCHYYFKEYYGEDNLKYRMVLIKMNCRDHIVVMPFSHLIYDITTNTIVRQKLMEYYKNIEQQETRTLDSRKSYWDYIKLLQTRGTELNEMQILKDFQLKRFKESMDKVAAKIRGKDKSRCTKVSFTISQEELRNKQCGSDVYHYSLQVFLNFCQKYFGIEDIPLSVISFGRHYGKDTFYDKIGEFIDMIPVLLPSGEKNSVENIPKLILEKIKTAEQNTVNLFNIAYEKKIEERYPELYSYVHDIFSQPLILFNYQGEVEEDFMNMVNEWIDSNMIISNVSRIMFEVKYESNRIRYDLLIPYVEEEKEMIQLLKI